MQNISLTMLISEEICDQNPRKSNKFTAQEIEKLIEIKTFYVSKGYISS